MKPKMTKQEAVALWNSLTPAQRFQFNELLRKMKKGELMIKHVNVDDNEQIQNIVLEPKEKPSIPVQPFAKYFKHE